MHNFRLNTYKIFNNKKIIFLIFFILILITLFTNYYGSTDLADYSDTAKYFAGIYPADIRSSHSYLYGFIHAPLVKISDSFLVFKITSLIFLFAIIYSVYIINNLDKKAFLLMLFSPVVWYMAPWINPIQIASLFLLWAYYFIEKYDKSNNLKFLLCAGVFIGLSWAFWDTMAFFGAFLIASFMYNKKVSHLCFVLLFIFIGLLPRLILDFYLFDFIFFTLLKSFFGTLTNAFFQNRGTAYSQNPFQNIFYFALILFSLPLYSWTIYRKDKLLRNKKAIIFVSLSVLLILINPQIRYVLAIAPIMTLLISKEITLRQYKKQIIFSTIISLIFIFPYIVQIGYHFNNSEFYDITEVITRLPNLSLTENTYSEYIADDLGSISEDYSNESFVVLGQNDYYQWFAHVYWGDKINELVSIQDYELWKNNETAIFEKRFAFYPKRINDRRSIWIGGGIGRNIYDSTDYSSINYALTLNDNIGVIPDFHKIKKYQILTLWQKD